MKLRRIYAFAIALSILSSGTVFADGKDYATRGFTADYLLKSAKFYNPNITEADIIKGDENGNLNKDKNVTKAEAFVMLSRAFGQFPELVGNNLRLAYPKTDYNDIPLWANDELSNVFDAGIAIGLGDGSFGSSSPITEAELTKMTKRAFTIFSSNLKDDFYAVVNKDYLETAEIKPGRTKAGTINDLSDNTNLQVAEIIDDILANGPYEKGSTNQKIYDLYNTIADKEGRANIGLAPILPYLEELDKVNSIDELMAFQNKTITELTQTLYLGFGLTVDAKDSTKYSLTFSTVCPSMDKSFYEETDEAKTNAFLKYIKSLLVLAGEDEEKAENDAKLLYDYEKNLAASCLDRQEYYDIDKTYNLFTFDELQEKFPTVDLHELINVSGFKEEEKYVVSDKGLLDAASKTFNEDNLDALKVIGKIDLISSWGGMLDDRTIDIGNTFNQEYLGVSGTYTDEERAKLKTQSIMSEYIGQLYIKKYFSEEAKQDVTNIVKTIIATYKNRIDALSWMSPKTKEKAKAKLDTITIKVGYPDNTYTYMDDVTITSKEDGGSFFSNALAISKESAKYYYSLQGTEVDKTEWAMTPFTVNACYGHSSNDITFPAGILQAPFYDVNASAEENYGGIGYVIAHEITHAFDNNGAKFDENGNAADWWTEEDYSAFEKLCDEMVAFYDSEECAPGIPCNGMLTLSENIADQGAFACISEIVSGFENPNYDAFYKTITKAWAITNSRETADYLSKVDVHSPGKLRVNRVLVTSDKFFETYGITENDGMYVAPEERIKIW